MWQKDGLANIDYLVFYVLHLSSKGLVIITALRGLVSEHLFVRQYIGLQRSLGPPSV